jgi:DNA-binding response OmpR family regulator
VKEAHTFRLQLKIVCALYTTGSTNSIGLQTVRILTILFVDNDLKTRNRIQQTLKDDFVVHCAASVTEAKRWLATSQPDILIAEVPLDAENGLDLCRYVRSIPELQRLPIMLLTSLTTLRDKVAGFDAGADDYVVKPYDARHLKARIRLLARIKAIEQHASS